MRHKQNSERVRINFFLLKSQKLELQATAKAQGITVAELLRNMVRKELAPSTYYYEATGVTNTR